MTSNNIKADARVVQAVRTLKEHPQSKDKNILNNNSDKSTSGDSKDDKKEDKKNSVIKKKLSTKISIDGAENLHNNLSKDKNNNKINNNNKDILNLKGRLSQSINVPINNDFNFNSPLKNSNLYSSINLPNGIKKGKSKYIQSLLNDMSIKKYKQTCISFLKEDNLIKQLYEENGFEKTNFSYDNFIEKYFFSSKLFMFKLEITLMSEDNLTKKNVKEKFFKKEILNFLQKIKSDKEIINKKSNLKVIFDNHFNFIKNFDLFQ